MNILYISEIYPDVKRGLGVWGGGERQFFEISRRIADLGHNVTVLTCRFPNQPSEEILDGIRVVRYGLSRDAQTGGVRRAIFPILPYIFKTSILAINFAPDLIHCNTYFPVYAGAIASLFKNIPVVNTFHDIYGLDGWIKSQRSLFWGFLGHAATTIATKCPADHLIAVSPQCKKKLLDLGVQENRVTIIPNGVDLALFDSIYPQKNHKQILYVGRLVNSKHVDWLIQAFDMVLKKIPDASLKIVGSGPEWENLHQLVKSLDLEKKVVFTGRTATYSAVAQYFKESTVFVLPSTVEGEAIVLKEAMTASLPLIAMNVPGSGVLSLVQDGKNGFLIEPANINLMAKKIIELLLDEEKARRLGKSGRLMIETHDWNAIAEQTLNVYENALGTI